MLLAMTGFGSEDVTDGKVSSAHLASGALGVFRGNVSGIALGSLQHVLHGDVIAEELKKCSAHSDWNVIEPDAGEKGAGQKTNTEIKIRAGQFTVYIDAADGQPDRCWELSGKPLRAELPPGQYAIYIHDKADQQMYHMPQTTLEADHGYVLLK
jgi:hypothetical protein